MDSIKDSWDKLSPESMRFILDQAEKNLQATVETAKILTDRAINVLQFSIPISIGLMGIITSQQNNKPIFFASILGIIFSLAITFVALQIYGLYKIQDLGNRPTNLLKEENLAIEPEFQEMGFQFSTIRNIEGYIEANETSNQKRSYKMYWIMQSIRYGFGSVIFLYLALRLWFVG